MDNLIQEPNIKSIIESLLFVSDKPLLLSRIKMVLRDIDEARFLEIIRQLQEEYEQNQRGIRIIEVAGGYQMVTASEFSSYIKELFRERNTEKLSGPSLETLAIVAYKQPLTRLDIEAIRGVNTEGVLKNLLDKGLVKITGRRDTIGRPFLYGTTRQFLEHFGLKSLGDLPKIEEFSLPVTKDEDKAQEGGYDEVGQVA